MQFRALGLAGKRVLLLAPVGPRSISSATLSKVASVVARIDHASVLLVNIKTNPVRMSRVLPNGEDSVSDLTDAPWETSGRSAASLRGPVDITRLDSFSSPPEDLPAMIERGRISAKYIFVEADDVRTSAATLLAGSQVDGIILTVAAGAVRQRDLAMAEEQYRRLRIPVAGFIFLE